MLKESENPPLTWPEGICLREYQGTWWVAHTKSRNEKALAHDLLSRQVSYFLPMTWNVRQARGRRIRTLLPLFSGYLFFCGNENDRLQALRTNRIANIIDITDQQKFVGELEQINHALTAGSLLTPHNYIKQGQRCRVIAGPLADLEGIVVRNNNNVRLVLQIDMLGQAASVEIDTDMIESLDEEENHG